MYRILPMDSIFRSSRRKFLGALGLGTAALGTRLWSAESAPASGPFAQRGYYFTFMRMPTYGRRQWAEILDYVKADGGNLIILWMGGGFRSKKFPVTWKFNEEHENVRQDFGRELLQDAHQRQIKVLLGFTPFGYDGVNQFTLEHPELKAQKKSGEPTDSFGIYSWGWNLCPSRPRSQEFMRDYVREMLFEFYPEADGLFVESSDYAICECGDCRGKFFAREFEFVQDISREVWARKPDATVVVYPHYFSGKKVPGFDAVGATYPFDPRWSLCFTPHSAPLDANLIKQARMSLWSDDSPALRDPAAIQRNVQRARDAGVSGYIPSLEAFTYIPTHVEEGESYHIGKRQVPLGFGWLKPDEIPYRELPARVNRLAYAEYCRAPDLSVADFKVRLGKEIFGQDATEQQIEDLLQVQRWFNVGRTWCQGSLVTSPARVKALQERGKLTAATSAELRTTLEQVKTVSLRYAFSANPAAQELHRITHWILRQWE